MSDEEEDDLGIKPGTVIDSSKANYVVIKLLGEGGFGAVFKVHDQKDPTKLFAMKVEKKLETRKHSKLKMEIAILKLVSQERKQSHFTSIIDRGKKETYFFLVMELVGKSLADLKNQRPGRVFSISTGLGASIQCLEACEDLHKYGFIHRDLKPANYACGLREKKRVIYILDFGIARRILNDKGELKTPRMTVKFKGTIPFASISCHRNTEMGPKDDYCTVHLIEFHHGYTSVYKFPSRIYVRKWSNDSISSFTIIDYLDSRLSSNWSNGRQ
ncbi:hypothetical protein RB195_011311 [Necator americanus]|uniref:Protein kinase domain-containing protein n=1 Tax=Necator americanus TaxID=51031 RepID=A0ABR1D1U3_NECAM